MLKDGWINLKQCPHYRGPETLKEGDTGCCNLGSQTDCNGEVHFCENPEVLKQYLSERGLGWQKKKGKERFKKVLQAIVRLKNACRR